MRFEQRYTDFCTHPAFAAVFADTNLVQLISGWTSLLAFDCTCKTTYLTRAPVARYTLNPNMNRKYLEDGLINAVINRRVGDAGEHLTMRDVELEFDETEEFVTRMKKVKSLGVVLDEVDDWTYLGEVPNVHGLKVAQISELKVGDLDSFYNLRELSLDNVNIFAIGVLSSLRFLERLTFEAIDEFLPPSSEVGLERLKFFALRDSGIECLDFLGTLTAVEEVHLVDAEVASLETCVDVFPNVTRLTLLDTMAEDLSALSNCERLMELVTDQSGLITVPKLSLKKLVLVDEQANDISKCAEFDELEVLWIKGTAVDNLDCVRGLKKLTDLDCSGTKISDLSPLVDLPNLQNLDFSNTRVWSVAPLRDIKSLKICKTSIAKTLTVSVQDRAFGLDMLMRLLE